MNLMTTTGTMIKNVVFDFGNVLVRWEPLKVIAYVFPEHDPAQFYQLIRPLWIELNKGKISEEEATTRYVQELQLPEDKVRELLQGFKTSQSPVEGSLELLDELYKAEVPLYAITDNVREIMEYHAQHSNFLDKFRGIVVSANIGVLKPDPVIYKYLLNTYGLEPAETIFIDDIRANVEGAKAVGMHAMQFVEANQCRNMLRSWGLPV